MLDFIVWCLVAGISPAKLGWNFEVRSSAAELRGICFGIPRSIRLSGNDHTA